MAASENGTDGACYLDWAATTPLCEEAAAAMAPYFVGGPANLEYGGNANSLHSVGRRAFSAMEDARAGLAASIGCRPDELRFTSGATEADDTAVFGIAEARRARGSKRAGADSAPHIVVSSIEHEAVIEPAERLRRAGAQLTFVKPDSGGFIAPEALEAAMREDTVLVSVMLANNEVGSIQDIAGLARVAHAHGALMHTDATQALGKIPVDVRALDVDAASFSAHKVCGPKGIGALYLRTSTPCEPFMFGGGQESGFRSGTQNVAGMAGFAAAARALCEPAALEAERDRLTALRDALYKGLCAHPGVRPSVPCAPGSRDYLPGVVSVTVDGVESGTMVLRLDRSGYCVSGGSACSSGDLSPNRILTELGLPKDRALCGLRVSIGRYTSKADVDGFLGAFADMLAWARGQA